MLDMLRMLLEGLGIVGLWALGFFGVLALARANARRVRAIYAVPRLEMGQVAPLQGQAEELARLATKLYADGAVQGYYLWMEVKPFDDRSVDTMNLPLVTFTFRTASTLDGKGPRKINPVNPGK